ncbi:hypothetical protein [Gordonia sp. (in: high G+C Gram-positive bacteria)]|uniref:hypothetical protein n=1 Tax=Gordonia sp. (in: high G+C Gram-positive bacteria) TaxID=84139 RepID=UPI00169A87D1|nr:hypothetical protein [Gordonia sp. (in: high G+C Gram-positive bacteria)]NLG45333.1 hypothetical protein [Gordonia sp. (in: high G+C Gram-positive bacteria)]
MVVSGPFYRRRIPAAEIVGASVALDDGTTTGWLNWPVTRSAADKIVRLNLGGSASVTLDLADGSRIQFVAADLAAAQAIHDSIEAPLVP